MKKFSDSLHKTIEAKENVKIEENQTLASITYQIILDYIKNYLG